MSARRRKFLMAAGASLAAAWLALFLSNKGLLVWGSGPGDGVPIGILHCHYFTGTGVVEREAFYTEGGMVGHAACPRLIAL
jgi:hypothetical protein